MTTDLNLHKHFKRCIPIGILCRTAASVNIHVTLAASDIGFCHDTFSGGMTQHVITNGFVGYRQIHSCFVLFFCIKMWLLRFTKKEQRLFIACNKMKVRLLLSSSHGTCISISFPHNVHDTARRLV